MGWDADAIYNGEPFNYVDTDRDPRAAEIFCLAVEEARSGAGIVDAMLQHGSLDVSGYVRALAHFAGEVDKAAIWDVERTRELDQTITWPALTTVPEDERPAVAGARAFLRACARGGYGIQFDP